MMSARTSVVAEAMSWLGTPYHHAARVKGAGVDCAMLPAEVYHVCGLIPHIDPGHYPIDWHLHRSAERYLSAVLQYACEIRPDQVRPGDLVVWKYGRSYAHGAIIIDWPNCLHATLRGCVQMVNAEADTDLARRHPRFFTLWDDQL